MIRRGPSARTPRVGISIRPRGMWFYRRSIGSATRPPSTTTRLRNTLSNGGRSSTRRRGASSARRFPRVPSSWASRRSIGAKPGSTASAHSATASTMRGTPLQPYALRRRLWAGAWCSSTGSAIEPSLLSSGSTAVTTTGRQSARSLSFSHWSHPVFRRRPPRRLNALTAGGIGAQWYGEANTLSPEHSVDWPVIDEVARATRRCGSAPITEDFSGFPTYEELFGIPVRQGLLTAENVILGRRSAVAMDGLTAISQEAFFRMLARLMPTR